MSLFSVAITLFCIPSLFVPLDGAYLLVPRYFIVIVCTLGIAFAFIL